VSFPPEEPSGCFAEMTPGVFFASAEPLFASPEKQVTPPQEMWQDFSARKAADLSTETAVPAATFGEREKTVVRGVFRATIPCRKPTSLGSAGGVLNMYEAVSASTSNGRAGSPLTFKPLTVILASLLAAAVIATVGSLSEVSLGDENAHVRQARSYMRSGTRVPYDPVCLSVDDRIRYGFASHPLWHAGLALLWKAAGTDSDWLAQTYQAGLYLLLVLSVYFGARQIWSEEAASWAWLLVATMPMVCAYSMLLYLDVPGIAVSALGLLLLWKKKFLWCGVALGAAYLTKATRLHALSEKGVRESRLSHL